MSATNRPTTRWSSSTKSASSINPIPPIAAPRKKLYRPLNNQQQHTFTQRASKTRHDVEQLFKLYYSSNIKFDTFQKQIVTGTRIPSAVIHNNSSNAFHSKHCVSREDIINPSDIINEPQVIHTEPKQIPIKRTVQVRIDNNPIIVHSTSPSPEGIPMSLNSDLIAPENSVISTLQNELNESSLIKSGAFIEDNPTDSHEHNHLKKNRSTLPPIPSATLSLTNNRKDLNNLTYSSLSGINSLQQSNQPHIVTGTAVIVRERSPTKSALIKQRAKSCFQQTNLKTSAVSVQYDQPDFQACLGARVVSIPSKCSRYVLVSFPQVPVRYHAPTYVERILLPERFPALFQNIIHNRNNKE